MKTRRERILGEVEHALELMLYYHRKEDDELPVGSIQEAVAAGEITAEEIVEAFGEMLKRSLLHG